MTYNIIDIDLTHSRIDEVYNLSGDSIKVINATSDCFIQFDDTTQDPINLLLVDEIKIKFKKFYISNVGIKNQSIKIVVADNFNLDDRISITNYIKAPIPDPTPTPTQIINITNPEPNVQIELDLSNLNFSEFTDNGSNIRITNENHNPLPFYLDSFNKTAMTGKLFLKTPANIINSAIIFPADLNAPSVSDGNATFEFFDDFTGTAIDNTKWNIVNATGWSVVNGELRGSNTTGRIKTHKLFSDGIIQEVKARTVTKPTNGNMIGGFFGTDTNNFTVIQHPYWQNNPNNILSINESHVNIGDDIPAGNINFLQQYTVSPTTVNLKIIRLDTNILTHNTLYNNTVINESIALGWRPDPAGRFGNQSYETFWDWIRVRKVTAATAMIV